MENKRKTGNLTIKEIILKGSIIAIIVIIPSLVGFFISWIVLDDFIQAAFVGIVVYLIAMFFSLKISKKLLVRND